MGPPRPLFVYFCSFQTQILQKKTLGFSRIRTRIVGVEGEHADHLVITTAPFFILPFTFWVSLKQRTPYYRYVLIWYKNELIKYFGTSQVDKFDLATSDWLWIVLLLCPPTWSFPLCSDGIVQPFSFYMSLLTLILIVSLLIWASHGLFFFILVFSIYSWQ